MEKRYYTYNDAEQFTFYRIPKKLITEGRYKSVSVEAKFLYGLMLDRMGLSAKNNWVDEQNHVFIYFTIDDAVSQLCVSKNKALKLMSELVCAGLIEKKRQGLGKPDMIYVLDFNSGGVENSDNPSEVELQESQNTNPQNIKNGNSGLSENELQEVCFSNSNNTEKNNTEKNDNKYIDTESVKDVDDDEASLSMSKQEIRKRIEYDELIEEYDKKLVDMAVDIIYDVITSKESFIMVNGRKMHIMLACIHLKMIRYAHICHVLDNILRNNSQIRDMKAYLTAALINSYIDLGGFEGCYNAGKYDVSA